MKNNVILTALFLTACSSTGVIAMDAGTYMIAKKGAQLGFGPPIGIKGEVYEEANEYCARDNKVVETIDLKETNSAPAQSAAVSLTFRCVDQTD